MRGVDIPQVFGLDWTREVVEEVGGNSDAATAQTVTRRQRQYRLHAARVLGLVEDTSAGLRLTRLGRELQATTPRSEDERAVFRRAIRSSAILKELAPDLLGNPPPTVDELVQRILNSTTDLTEKTAAQRARALLSWARAIRSHEQLELHFDAVETDESGPVVGAIGFENFRSYRSARLPLAPLTILIGANAAGKSNALEGIRLLARLAKGTRLDDLLAEVNEDEIAIRGMHAVLGRRGADRFALTCDLSSDDADEEVEKLTIELATDRDNLRVASERLVTAGATELYAARSQAHGHLLEVVAKSPEGDVRVPAIDLQPVFMQLLSPASFADEWSRREIPAATNRVRDALSRIEFLDPVPQRMRAYAYKSDRRLKPDGANTSSILWHLDRRPETRERVLDFVRSLPEQDIRDIGFLEGPRNEVMVRLQEAFGGHLEWHDASLLSDGTLRVLAIAASLYSARPGSLVIIEEIDNGVHPSRAGTLLKNIRRASLERDLRVLLTTHNPALMDALPELALPEVVCCYRDPSSGDSHLLRLGDLDEYPELVAQGPLGDLVTRGVLDRYLKHRRPADQRVAERLAWFRRFTGS